MSKIITIHSFRRGVGKSSLSVNLAVLLAEQGYRVALIDTAFQSPSIHLFFNLAEGETTYTFNDYLWGKCNILSTAQDVTHQLPSNISGKLFVVPASDKIAEIVKTIRTTPNIDRYVNGLEKLKKELDLDILLVDTPAGLNEDTMQAIAVSNSIILVLHPDKHDFQGTAVTVEMIRRLEVSTVYLVLNDAPENLNLEDARLKLEQTYHCEKSIVLNHSEELMALYSGQPFALCYPEHILTIRIKELAKSL